MTGPDVAGLSPGNVIIAGSTRWHYRIGDVDRDDDRVVLCGPLGSLVIGYEKLQRRIENGKIEVRV